MCEKTMKVHRWLAAVFGEQPVPEFEVNTHTVEALQQLAEASERRCEEISLLIQDHRQKVTEYNSDATHLQEALFEEVGLQPGNVPKTTSDLLSVLEGTADVLKVKDTSVGSLVPAINKLTNDLAGAEKADRSLGWELSAVRKKMAATMMLRKELQEDVRKITQAQQVEAATAEERLLNMDFIKNKSKDLTYRNKLAQDKLVTRQMEDSLTHQSIVQLSEEVTAVKKEVLPLKKRLEPYSDLSSSPSLARVQVEEAKRELAALDAELEQKLDLMNAL